MITVEVLIKKKTDLTIIAMLLTDSDEYTTHDFYYKNLNIYMPYNDKPYYCSQTLDQFIVYRFKSAVSRLMNKIRKITNKEITT